MRTCQNLPDFFVWGNVSRTPLMFRLNSSRYVCIFATEMPPHDPAAPRAKVMTRNCANLVGSMWNIGEGNDVKVEKYKGLDPTGFCMRENIETSEVELEHCSHNLQEMRWKVERISFPGEEQ